MPAPSLLKELLHGRNWSALERRDVDLAPSPALEQRLSEVVSDWRSPAEKHRGFMAWALAQRQRRAYCPTCFQEDLAAGRTPYFRNDWIRFWSPRAGGTVRRCSIGKWCTRKVGADGRRVGYTRRITLPATFPDSCITTLACWHSCTPLRYRDPYVMASTFLGHSSISNDCRIWWRSQDRKSVV